MKRGIFLKTTLIFFLAGLAPLLLFYFLATKTYQEIEIFIPQLEFVIPELAEEMGAFYGSIRIQFALVFLLALIMIGFSSIIYARYLIISIGKLIRGAQKIARGDYNVKIKIRTKDELEVLGETFNKMARELKGKTEELQESRKALEVKVKARTIELEELTKSLEEKVRERTKELQERLNQLERFHKLTVGRELKMVELKKIIKELEKKLGGK